VFDCAAGWQCWDPGDRVGEEHQWEVAPAVHVVREWVGVPGLRAIGSPSRVLHKA